MHLRDLETVELPVQKINAVNVPDGLAVELITKELTLKLRGPAAQIRKLTGDDMTVTVDFTGAEIGTATFRGQLSFARGFEKVGTVQTVSVSASVNTVETMEAAAAAAAAATTAPAETETQPTE